MSAVAYISRRVVLPEGVGPACVVAEDGVIAAITDYASPPANATLVDAGSDAILPGLIDPHVHINEPGRTDWEGFATATRAAAAGGITTVIDMPLNCLPETTTVEALTLKRIAAQGQTHIDWRPWGGAVNGNQSHLQPLADAGVPGYKCFLLYPGCDGFGLIDESELRAAMPILAATDLPLLVHAELPGPLEAVAAGLNDHDWTRYDTYLASRPDEAELAAIRLLIALCREFGTRIHIVHLASAQALPLLRAAKAEGLPITVETCPHYLHFAAERIPDRATHLKCAPPFRSEANRNLLWQALADGTIDLIASDHSPCPPEMKRPEEGSFLTAWGGIASLSLGLPIIWTEMHVRATKEGERWDLGHVARLMATNPAKLAGLASRKGRIAPGYDADLVIFDPEATFTVAREHLHFRHPISPYLGETLHGVVHQTILRGTPVYDRGTFPSPGHGHEAHA
jgi:allantoinase